MPLTLVPFNAEWPTATGPSGAVLLDIKAIYRRPQKNRYGDLLRDEAGFVQWDLTGATPVQHHGKWVARGFQYVTLADPESLQSVSQRGLLELGVHPLDNPQAYRQNRFDHGPWDAAVYVADMQAERQAQHARLRENIERFGAEAAEEMERRSDPEYRIPPAFLASLQAPVAVPAKPGRPRKAAAVSA